MNSMNPNFLDSCKFRFNWTGNSRRWGLSTHCTPLLFGGEKFGKRPAKKVLFPIQEKSKTRFSVISILLSLPFFSIFKVWSIFSSCVLVALFIRETKRLRRKRRLIFWIVCRKVVSWHWRTYLCTWWIVSLIVLMGIWLKPLFKTMWIRSTWWRFLLYWLQIRYIISRLLSWWMRTRLIVCKNNLNCPWLFDNDWIIHPLFLYEFQTIR